MSTPPPASLPDPRTLPGNLGALRYLRPAPGAAYPTLLIVLLNLAGVVVIIATGLFGSLVGAYFRIILQILAAFARTRPDVTGSVGYTPILIGLLLGLLAGGVLALPLFARGQSLRLQMRIEENTRQTKELLYFLLAGVKKSSQ